MNSFLIVDRDRGLAEATRRCLVARGCDAAAAFDGLQCLEELRAIAPSVLVLDPGILWGGADGVLEYLNVEQPLTPPLIIAVEGFDGCRIPDRLLPWIDHHVQRPKALQDLLPFVHQLISIVDESMSRGNRSFTATSTTGAVGEIVVPASLS